MNSIKSLGKQSPLYDNCVGDGKESEFIVDCESIYNLKNGTETLKYQQLEGKEFHEVWPKYDHNKDTENIERKKTRLCFVKKTTCSTPLQVLSSSIGKVSKN